MPQPPKSQEVAQGPGGYPADLSLADFPDTAAYDDEPFTPGRGPLDADGLQTPGALSGSQASSENIDLFIETPRPGGDSLRRVCDIDGGYEGDTTTDVDNHGSDTTGAIDGLATPSMTPAMTPAMTPLMMTPRDGPYPATPEVAPGPQSSSAPVEVFAGDNGLIEDPEEDSSVAQGEDRPATDFYAALREAQPGMESGVSGQTQNTDASGNTLVSGASAASTSTTSSWKLRAALVARGAASAARRKIGGAASKLASNGPVDIDAKVIRRYSFSSGGRIREVTLSHAQYTWFLKVDDELLVSKAHSKSIWKTQSTSVDLVIPLSEPSEDFEPLQATLRMEWSTRAAKWKYSLLVGDVDLEPSWTKSTGEILGHIPPAIEPQASLCEI